MPGKVRGSRLRRRRGRKKSSTLSSKGSRYCSDVTATRLVGSLGLTVAMAVGVRGYVERNREHGDQHLGYVVLARDAEGACRLLYIVGNSVVAADAYTSLLDRCVIRLARAYLENMYQIYICVYGCEPDNVFLRFARG